MISNNFAPHLKVVINDCFNISNRLKLIDKRYLLVFNLLTKNFEVRDKNYFWFDCRSLCFVVGKNLDCLALNKAKQTMVFNIDNLIKSMDENNFNLEKQSQNKLLNKFSGEFSNLIDFLNNSSKTVDFSKLNKNHWI